MKRSILIASILAGVLIVVVLIYASRIIVFTNSFSTQLEVAKNAEAIAIEDIYATLNRMEEISKRPGECPNRLGDCWSVDGLIIVKNSSNDLGAFRIRLSTEELTTIWDAQPDPARHQAFLVRVSNALRAEGYTVDIEPN